VIECRTGVALWEMVMFSRGRIPPLRWSLSAVQNLQADPARQNSRWTGGIVWATQEGIARDLAPLPAVLLCALEGIRTPNLLIRSYSPRCGVQGCEGAGR